MLPDAKKAKGKSGSRENAVRHGMSAKTLLPDILGRGQIDDAYEQLAAEWNADTHTEKLLVREMARHHVALSRIQEIEEASLRRGAQAALEIAFGAPSEAGPEEERDAALTGAGTAEAVEKISRYRRAHERGFFRSFNAIQAIKERKSSKSAGSQLQSGEIRPDVRFFSETDCEAYLLHRLELGRVPCSECGERRGRWLPSRRMWRCGGCRRQASLRAGTIMAGSHLPLLAWFRAVELLIENPKVRLEDLKDVTAISRLVTLKRIVKKTQEAQQSAKASAMLAGLEDVFRAASNRGAYE